MLREYEVKHGYKFKRTINKKNKVGAFCLGIGYTLRIYVSLLPSSKTFMIKSLEGRHNCIRSFTINATKNGG
jgi:hypothetical protein